MILSRIVDVKFIFKKSTSEKRQILGIFKFLRRLKIRFLKFETVERLFLLMAVRISTTKQESISPASQ